MLRMPITIDDNDATASLGTFLLQGYVMTDESCSEKNCPIPIMRSKDGAIRFCVNHDPLPTSSSRNIKQVPVNLDTTNDSTTKKADNDKSFEVIEQKKSSSTTSDSDEFRLQQKRREQSSKASQLIGQKMLQRWVLLNETCPNEACYAIPLVRHPSNKTLYCVICEQSYQSEKDLTSSKMETTLLPESKPVARSSPPPPAAQKQETIQSSLNSPAVDRLVKRHKKAEATITSAPPASSINPTTLQNSRVATNSAVQCLSCKMTVLTTTLQHTTDPNDLILLCQTLEACAKALEVCTKAMDVCHRLS
ncbi:hypothetical protein BC941DRAFT_440731 [Chlamydoabsidia padenii]|nr:hypothetical protein BC941DRAFT_440731 [Chlamydoabsidia padenii]